MQNNKFVIKWGHDRKKGKLLYTLLTCLVMGSSTLAGAVIGYLFTGKMSYDITIGLIIGGVIGGAVGGIIRWNSNEEKYKKLKDADSD